MPLPFIIGIGAVIAGKVAAVAATAATVGATVAGATAAKVAVGALAGFVIGKIVLNSKITESSLKDEIRRLKQENSELRKKCLEARVRSIFESGNYAKVNIGLYESGELLTDFDIEARNGIDRNEIYEGHVIYC